MSLRVCTIDAFDEFRRLSGEWHELLARTDNRVPFLLPEWLTTWWRTFRQDHALIRDTLRIKVVRDEAERLVGVAPFMLTERPPHGPIRARGLSLLGADRYITEHRAPVVDPERAAEVAYALATDLKAEEDWDWIVWDGLSRGSEFALAIEAAMGAQWSSDAETASVLRLEPTWDAFKAGLRRNIKESLRHCYNSLNKVGSRFRLEVAETPAEVRDALEVFFRLHALRANQAGVPHPNRFASIEARGFLVETCMRLAERRIPRVFTLQVGDVPVAARVGFVLPGCLYLYYSGFEPAWGKYSVMTTTVAEAIKYAIRLGLPEVHLSMGADASKARWGPQTALFHRALCVRPRTRSRAVLRLYSWGRENADRAGAVARLLPVRQFEAPRRPSGPRGDRESGPLAAAIRAHRKVEENGAYRLLLKPRVIANHLHFQRELAARPIVMRSQPSAVEIEITSRRRLALQCLRSGGLEPYDIRLEDFRRILEQFPNTLDLSLDGFGEALLHPRFFEIVSHARARLPWAKIAVSSDGMLLDDDVCERLPGSGLTEINVSIDAALPSTHQRVRPGGDLATVHANLRSLLRTRRRARAKHPLVGVNYVLQNENEGELVPFIEQAAEIGVDYVNCVSFATYERGFRNRRSKESYRRELAGARACLDQLGLPYRALPEADWSWTDEARPFDCSFFWGNKLHVANDGTVTLGCCTPSQETYSYGNVLERPFATIWNGEAFRRNRALTLEQLAPAFPCAACTEACTEFFRFDRGEATALPIAPRNAL